MIEFINILPQKVKIVKREDFILSRCKDKTVLHLGCVDAGIVKERVMQGQHLHVNLYKVTKCLYGIDIDEQGIEFLKINYGIENVYQANLETFSLSLEFNKKFEVIVASEIIEHLRNFENFLKNMKKLCTKNTEIIITTPNAFSFWNFYNTLKKKEIVHPTHSCWFSLITLKNLLNCYGYEIKEVYLYSNFNLNYKNFKNLLFYLLIKLFYKISPFLQMVLY